MRKILTTMVLTLLTVGAAYSQSTDQNPSVITQEEKRLEATIYCVDVQMEVAPHNEFALQFVSLPDFPRKSAELSKKELHVLVDEYFQNHPDLIDKVRAERKKAHDKLYGPRPY
jgi:hypothetical protein